jgi:hypothetical protein
MGLIQKVKEKAGKIAPAVMGLSMIACAGMMAVTGDAAAAGENLTTEGWFQQYSLLTYIFGALTVIFGVATLWMKDFRIALVTLVMGVIALLSVYIGI